MEGITAELLKTWGYGKIDTCNLQIDFITTLPAKATTADFITTLPAFLKAFQISGYEPPSGDYGGSNNRDSFTSALIPIISKDIAVIKASDQMGNGKIGGTEIMKRYTCEERGIFGIIR
ncbi:uncharacterized protein LOC122063782 isoform X2 [Macadamia integrifolia]|uniref:uncharacterized protein LOC122063782 isoform X2 n=1 Tax=Macadamia integrifolia TaxID=60698 RepID=UPI001C4F2E32|nr:uncharacterized protein LOC122063782 isoform X2 [Macadamia integrifolia]